MLAFEGVIAQQKYGIETHSCRKEQCRYVNPNETPMYQDLSTYYQPNRVTKLNAAFQNDESNSLPLFCYVVTEVTVDDTFVITLKVITSLLH